MDGNEVLGETIAATPQVLDAAGRHEPGAPRTRQGKRAEAHALLAPIYGWFTEGLGPG